MAAGALGFDFTVADMEKANAEAQELDPIEMETAAGGWCLADYDCYTAWNHDTPNQPGNSCLADYDCITAFHNSKFLDAVNDPDAKGGKELAKLIQKLLNGG